MSGNSYSPEKEAEYYSQRDSQRGVGSRSPYYESAPDYRQQPPPAYDDQFMASHSAQQSAPRSYPNAQYSGAPYPHGQPQFEGSSYPHQSSPYPGQARAGTSPYPAQGTSSYVDRSPRTSPGNDPTSGGQGTSSGGIMGKLKGFAPGESVSALLDPPPPPFLRSPPNNLPYSPFEPAALFGTGKDLNKGFPPMPPPSATVPHPFATHDVTEADWTRFLHDVKIAASLTPRDRIVAGVAPMALNIGLMGILVSKGIEKRQTSKKSDAVGQLIDSWNHSFFHPRRVNVVLAQGPVSYNSQNMPPPDMAHFAGGSGPQGAAHDDDDYSSDSSSSDDPSGRREKISRRSQRRIERSERRASRRERRERKREKRGAKGEQWRLVVAFKPFGRGM